MTLKKSGGENMDFWELLVAIITAIGAVGGVAVFVFKWASEIFSNSIIEKFKSNLKIEEEKFKSELLREVEIYRTKLKKSEFLFQKQYEAASEFTAMKRGFQPEYRFQVCIGMIRA